MEFGDLLFIFSMNKNKIVIEVFKLLKVKIKALKRAIHDDLIKEYQEVYKTYQEAQIKRDAEVYNLNRAYANGSIMLEQYLAKFQ